MISERKKIKDYDDRIRKQLGGDFIPCVLSSGGAIGSAANKIINLISNKLAVTSMEKLIDIKASIKTDLVMALLKSRVQSLRCCRNDVKDQLSHFRNIG